MKRHMFLVDTSLIIFQQNARKFLDVIDGTGASTILSLAPYYDACLLDGTNVKTKFRRRMKARVLLQTSIPHSEYVAV